MGVCVVAAYTHHKFIVQKLIHTYRWNSVNYSVIFLRDCFSTSDGRVKIRKNCLNLLLTYIPNQISILKHILYIYTIVVMVLFLSTNNLPVSSIEV